MGLGGYPLTRLNLIIIPELAIAGTMTRMNPTEDPGTPKECKWER